MPKILTKWERIRKSITENDVTVGPIIHEGQLKRLYRSPEIGSPNDTTEEVDQQKNNLGPIDGIIERINYQAQSAKRHGANKAPKNKNAIQEDPSPEEQIDEHEHHIPRPNHP